jgi:hypothetical protein
VLVAVDKTSFRKPAPGGRGQKRPLPAAAVGAVHVSRERLARTHKWATIPRRRRPPNPSVNVRSEAEKTPAP